MEGFKGNNIIDKDNGYSNKKGIRAGFEDSRSIEFVNKSKRLSKDEESGRTLGGSRNVAATEFLRGYDDSNSEKQQDRLIEWAKETEEIIQ
jgi:hypothetical protein